MNISFTHIKQRFLENFSFDLRALALMRMGIAIIILIDLLIRSHSLIAFYTDEGVLPLSTLYRSNWNPSFFSVYAISTGWKIIALLFIINAIFSLFLFLGFKTRIMTILCWIMMVSLHNRNPLILQGGDELLRLTLFWAIFIPWGKRYSVDAIGNSQQNEQLQQKFNNKWFGLGGIGFLMLVFSVYFFSAILKNSNEWARDGTALYYALSIDQIAWPLGRLIYPYPTLLKALTFITYYLELFSPFLLLIPFRTTFLRNLFIFLIGSLHLCISLNLYVGLFYLIGLTTLIGLLPEKTMNFIVSKTTALRKKIRNIFLKIGNALKNSVQINFKPSLTLTDLMQFQLKLIYAGILVFLIAFNLLWCSGQVPQSRIKVSDQFLWLAYTFRFDQDWGMFAPRVYKNDGWYIYEAELENQQTTDSINIKIDLNRGGANVTYAKPSRIIALYEDDRWRKFGELWQYQPDKVKKEFCRYLKNKWNREHPKKRISTLKIIYMLETSLPDYKTSSPVPTTQCDCENWSSPHHS